MIEKIAGIKDRVDNVGKPWVGKTRQTKQNTEQLKKIEEILNKLAYNCLNYEKEGNNYMVSDALKDLLPHLISSDEIKREALEGFGKWLQTDSEQLDENGYPLIYGLDDKDGDFLMMKELVKDYLSYLTQSKEGGE